MKEKLIAYWERKEQQMETYPEGATTLLGQAFGALEMVLSLTDDWDKESELIDLWNDEWRERLEKKVCL